MTISDRVKSVRQRMENAAAKAGRRAEEITLVGVTKTQPAEAVRELILAGVDVIGENRVQELLQKAPLLQGLPHKTHLIGHLQRNKAKFLPGNIDMLQSLASEETLLALEKVYQDKNTALDVLIEVNIGEESSKSGIDAGAVSALADRVLQSGVLRLRGLMAIPPATEGEAVRTYFRQMRQLFIDIQAKTMDNNTVNVLSMGMSSDFEYAILEGATMVRVGTELFGPRQYH
ncbi:MAG TPA: YggS family pyridoxal phosphate-dependent enzyme [Clostridiales bacterium]|nr:YggS family pyridoxal phosphate-dependent enzyme [Clostridiales bacterium]